MYPEPGSNALVILAGGKSRRMGTDKVFLDYQGGSFLEHLIRKAVPYFDRILISAGSAAHAQQIRQFLAQPERPEGRPLPEIIPDHYDSLGPAGGLMSVFEETGLDSFAAVAVDLPDADMQVLSCLESLLKTIRQEPPASPKPCAVMLALHPEHPEPCAAAYHRFAYGLLKSASEAGIRSPFRAIGKERILFVTPEELKKSSPCFLGLDFETSFRNINTMEDLAATVPASDSDAR